jgi:hypothetical protein
MTSIDFDPATPASEPGYRVTLTYDVQSAVGEFELSLIAHSVESTGAGSRRWFIIFQPSSLVTMKSNTELGRTMINSIRGAYPLAKEWTTLLQERSLGGRSQAVTNAYLDTLFPEERGVQMRAWTLSLPTAGALAGFAPAAAVRGSADLVALHKGRQAFVEGRALTAEPGIAKEIVNEVKGLFSEPATGEALLELIASSRVPFYKQQGKQARLRFPARLSLGGRPFGTMPRYLVEAELSVEGPVSEEPIPPSQFRVIGLHLQRVTKAPQMGMGQGPR